MAIFFLSFKSLILAQCKKYKEGIQKQSNILCEKFKVCGGYYLEYMGRGDNEWKNKIDGNEFFFNENSPLSTLKKGPQKAYCELE